MEKEICVQEVIDFAVDAGALLLKSGAELFRVEDTIQHICKYFNVEFVEVFILSNGIFVSAGTTNQTNIARIKHIPLAPVNLEIVDEVNSLSRHICQGKYSLQDARIKLENIKKLPMKSNMERILASGIGSFGFCFLVQATILDCIVSMFIAFILYVFVLICYKNSLSKLILNTFGGALIAFLAVIVYWLVGADVINFDKVIIGSIFPLVPGMGFTNAIRDLVNSDVLSGVVRMVDSILVFIYIAIGVGTVLSVFSGVIGGML